MRRRREEEGIQLRKQKREQQLIKRRNVDVPVSMESDIIQVGMRVLVEMSWLKLLYFLLGTWDDNWQSVSH